LIVPFGGEAGIGRAPSVVLDSRNLRALASVCELGGLVTTHPATLGRFFEGFVVGDVYQHPLGRTITEADNTWLTLLSMNTNQNHFNAHLAGQNPLTQGRVIVDSGLTITVVLGISVLDMSQNAIAKLEMTDVRLTHPLYVGDTLYAESVCTAPRPSASSPSSSTGQAPSGAFISRTSAPRSSRSRTPGGRRWSEVELGWLGDGDR
jgi:itaconyl-CoA hydratase